MTQEKFLVLANKRKNIFLEGVPGAGKTFIVSKWRDDNEGRLKIITVSYTGLAAINIGGSTIHSTFKIFGNEYKFINHQKINWDTVDVLIIDEISTVSCDLFNHINRILNTSTGNNLPFGGIQVICLGDKKQLAPIFNMNNESEKKRYEELKGNVLFDNSSAYTKGKFHKIFLSDNKRSGEVEYNDILNRARNGEDIIHLLKHGIDDTLLQIMPYNNQIDYHNEKMLNRITTKEYIFKGTIQGDFKTYNILTPLELHIKVGANIMITANLPNGLVNGDLGNVININKEYITIRSSRKCEIYKIEKYKFQNITYEKNGDKDIKGSLLQFPMKLAYAITVHKCIEGNQLIKGKDKWFKISDGQIGQLVYTTNGLYPIIGKQYMGNKETFKITSGIGLELICTKDHKIFIGRNGLNQYIEVQDLLPTDKLIIDRTFREYGNKININPVPLTSRSKKVLYNEITTEELSYYIGLIIGDGSYNYKKDGRIDLESSDKEILNFLNSFYTNLNINELQKKRKITKSTTSIITSRNFRDTLKSIGIDYVIGYNKKIPEIFLSSTLKERIKLLKGLFDTDGSCSKEGRITYCSTSKTLINQIQLLLLDLGIISYIKKLKLNSVKHNQAYHLHITGNNVILFNKYIGFNVFHKQDKLNKWIIKIKGKSNIDYIINRDEVIDNFKKIIGGKGIKGLGYSNDRKITAILRYKNLSYTQLEYLYNFVISKGLNFNFAKKILDNNYYYDSIKSIENNGNEDVYDIEVNTEHSFIAQGIITHNCQGLTLENYVFHYNHGLSKQSVYVALSRGISLESVLIYKKQILG